MLGTVKELTSSLIPSNFRFGETFDLASKLSIFVLNTCSIFERLNDLWCLRLFWIFDNNLIAVLRGLTETSFIFSKDSELILPVFN